MQFHSGIGMPTVKPNERRSEHWVAGEVREIVRKYRDGAALDDCVNGMLALGLSSDRVRDILIGENARRL